MCQRFQSGTSTKYRRQFWRIRHVNVGHIVSVYSIAEVARLAHRSCLPPSLLKEDDVLCVCSPSIFSETFFLNEKLGQCSFLQHQFFWIGAPINVVFIPLCQDVPVCRATVEFSKGCTRIADVHWPMSMAGCHGISLTRWSYITWLAPLAQGGPSRVLHRMLCTVLLHMEGLQHENGCAFVWQQSSKSRQMDQFVVALCWKTGLKSGSRISTTFGYEFGGHFDVWQREQAPFSGPTFGTSKCRKKSLLLDNFRTRWFIRLIPGDSWDPIGYQQFQLDDIGQGNTLVSLVRRVIVMCRMNPGHCFHSGSSCGQK